MKSIGNAITCPGCAKQLQRSCRTESAFVCPRCGNHFYVYLKMGVQLVLPDSPADEVTSILLRDYAAHIIRLTQQNKSAS